MLVDRTVLITGASSGIGRACARAFAARGARLVLCARRTDRLDELASELAGEHSAEVETAGLDVRDREAVARVLGGVGAPVDVLVNNAGLAAGFGPLHENDPADWDRMLDTNVTGLLNVTQAVVPAMVERGEGHVINIGSVAARDTYPGGVVYCASKAAVDRITRGLRMDLLGTGVKVSTVDPGLVETEFALVRFEGDADRAQKVYEGIDALTGDDVAEAAAWVADQPPHVQVSELVLLARDQASATRMVRR